VVLAIIAREAETHEAVLGLIFHLGPIRFVGSVAWNHSGQDCFGDLYSDRSSGIISGVVHL
jgi:hypothetical protein